MALHARATKGQRILEGGVRPRLSLRKVLLILALVPTLTLVSLWGLNSTRLYRTWHDASVRGDVGNITGLPALTVFYQLEVERDLSAGALADPAAYQAALGRQRQATDAAIAAFRRLPAPGPADIAQAEQLLDQDLDQVAGYRTSVDQHSATQQQVFDDYTGVIEADLTMFEKFSDLGIADLDLAAKPLLSEIWAGELISREDAVMTAGLASGRFTAAQRDQIDQLVGAQQFVYGEEVVTNFPPAQANSYRAMLASSAWQEKTAVEQEVLGAAPVRGGEVTTATAAMAGQWQQTMTQLLPRLGQLTEVDILALETVTFAGLHTLVVQLIQVSSVGGAGVVIVMVVSILLTTSLRRRIFGLRRAADDLRLRMPEVVDRLARGEDVDPEAELPALQYGTDELGALGQALNAARAGALEAAVRQAEQYRGFGRLLQRIARRTQLLIGLQMKKINEMERRHEDAEVLEELFDLDHLTARLRRYEENLVILGGGQPQRRWRKPVPVLDVLRAAQGEVQDYPRIRISVDEDAWMSERAVGPVVHVLAELMENAVAFSRPPAPVEVVAARVVHGLAVEIEDRGVGMEPEQYDQANAMMASPPTMDVVSRSDDARLGMLVVARLAAGLGLRVEFRPSSFGGTRVVVLVPAELLSEAPPGALPDAAFGPGTVPAAPRLSVAGGGGVGAGGGGETRYANGAGHADDAPAQPVTFGRLERGTLTLRRDPRPRDDSPAAATPAAVPEPRLTPLPRRTRLASLPTELRKSPSDESPSEENLPGPGDGPAPELHEDPGRSSATIGAFQRVSRLARIREEAPDGPAPGPVPDPAPGPVPVPGPEPGPVSPVPGPVYDSVFDPVHRPAHDSAHNSAREAVPDPGPGPAGGNGSGAQVGPGGDFDFDYGYRSPGRAHRGDQDLEQDGP